MQRTVVASATDATSILPRTETVNSHSPGMPRSSAEIDILAAALDQEPASAVGGQLAHGRLRRHLTRARAQVTVAQQGHRVGRHLCRALGHIDAFENVLRREARHGRVTAAVNSGMQSLASAVTTEIGGLL